MSLKGSFRGADFFIPEDDVELGRRNQVFEYPLRDDAYVEDMGKKVRKYNIPAVVIGKDYKQARDKLIVALEKPGAGTLVHPEFGTMQVSIVAARMKSSSRELGKVTFSISFVQAKDQPRYPTATNDTAEIVDTKANDALGAVLTDFNTGFNVTGFPQYIRDAASGLSGTALDAIGALAASVPGLPSEMSDLVGDIASANGSLSSLVGSPASLASEMVGLIGRLTGIVKQPVNALSIYRSLFSHGDDALPVPRTTVTRQRQSSNQAAIDTLVQRTAVIEAARTSAQLSYANRSQAIVIRDELAEQLDNHMEATRPDGSPISDQLFMALVDLRVAVIDDLTVRGAELPLVVNYTPFATLPAPVIAHQIYGDARRADEIVASNPVRHPGFIEGGQALEVLNA
ncbi:DNA circularization protein [Sulfuriflexus mobilis]|uniref:DNA circularization protein n=1 Tax=Sulfuriflexus mobilis TaxID=1811807 RepID=UPI000F84E5DD|nr:DNA circularization N-terminal domain-containing protein [Sulfuriflexus mobilis]